MRRALAALAAAGALGAAAEDARWYAKIDNDVLFHTDRWYSSGVRIARVAAEPGGASEWGLLHEVYTPEAKRFVPSVTLDRAPTARLLASHARHWSDDDRFATVEADLGVRGEGAGGERVTDAIHRVISAPHVDWSRETRSQVDASLAATDTRRFGFVDLHYGAVVGTERTFAHAGLQVNAGPAVVPSETLRYVATPPFALTGGARAGWGAFAGASVRGVARDRLLDRGYDPMLPPPERRRTVARAAMGASYAGPWGIVSLVAMQESREFAAQREPQRFGSLVVHIPF